MEHFQKYKHLLEENVQQNNDPNLNQNPVLWDYENKDILYHLKL
jgi:hypothetical protein